MKKTKELLIIALFLGGILVFCLLGKSAAYQNADNSFVAETPTDSEASAKTERETETQTEIVESEDAVPEVAEGVTKEKYDRWMQMLAEQTEAPVLNLIYEDLDNDGVVEALAFCGEETEKGYKGDFYLLTDNQIMEIDQKYSFYSYLNMGEIVTFDGIKLILLTDWGDDLYEIRRCYYFLNEGKLTELYYGFGDELLRYDAGRLCMGDEYYWDGVTYYIPYYFYVCKNELREYGGMTVSTEDFATFQGADVILDQIENDGYKITSIYQRTNGIVNINCKKGRDKRNVRAMITENRVEVMPVTEGNFYEMGETVQALYPGIAFYGDHAEELREKIKAYADEPIVNFIYDDFDGNGTYEALVVCGMERDLECKGEIYFVSDEGIREIPKNTRYDYTNGCCKVFDLDGAKIICIEYRETYSSALAYYYQVKDNVITELEGSGFGNGLLSDADGRAYIVDSCYDYMKGGGGHTWNAYYVYWDDGMKEYGGTEISVEEFLAYEGADAIIAKIKGDGYYLGTIYRRANGIININCGDDEYNLNVRVVVEGERAEVSPVDAGFEFYEEGVIHPALTNLAVY